MAKILIIDDDVDICALLQGFLKRKKHSVEAAYSIKAGLKALGKGKFDIVLCDYRLPDGEGVEVLNEVRKKDSDVKVIIITGYSDVKMAVECIRKGAADYVTKPLYPEEILLSIERAVEAPKTESKISDQKVEKQQNRRAPIRQTFIQGKSPQSKQVEKLVGLVGPTEMSVVIIGDTGTGKEFVARNIHNKSNRSQSPFVAIDCGALPKDLGASELFGHKKGSFTGATSDKVGSFELANGGTLFLDEIANLSYDNQVKLLRVIQERKIKPVGGLKNIPVDVRIIAASNENLWKKSQAQKFREDLYHRINEFTIELAPLRDRKSEIEQFAEHFIQESNDMLNKSIEGFTEDAMEKLKDYYWHGNLRELKNVVKKAVLLTAATHIDTAQLPIEIVNGLNDPGTENADSSDHDLMEGTLKEVTEKVERKAILKALKRTNYNKSKTAELLGVDRKTLYNKISAYGIQLG